MDIRELRCFAAVFEERSVTAAARRCFISQPSVSAAIVSLEQTLETRLFVRHKKGVTPTASAEELYPMARRMVDGAEAMRRHFRKPAERRNLTVGLMRTLDARRAMELLRPLTDRQDVSLHLVGPDDPSDVRIVSRTLLKETERFTPLWSERYVAVLPTTHDLALKETLRAGDLAGARFIDRCHCENSHLFVRGGLPRDTVAIAESEDWAVAMVAAGLGVAILPEGVAAHRTDVAIRVITDIDIRREVGLAIDATASPSTQLQDFIDGLKTPRPQSRPRA